MITLDECPKLQFSDYNLLRKIDVLWFRNANTGFYPVYALRWKSQQEYGLVLEDWRLCEIMIHVLILLLTRIKFQQVITQFPEIKSRFVHVMPDQIGLLYSAEKI